MPGTSAISRQANDALRLLATMIRTARIQRGMTAAELATRTGVSRGVIQRLEAGEGGTAIGTAFEACVVLGIPLLTPPASACAPRLSIARKWPPCCRSGRSRQRTASPTMTSEAACQIGLSDRTYP